MDTLEYLRKIITGQINRQEKQLLEKASLDDEFLGDALEGFELYQKKEGQKLMNRLFTALDQKTSNSKARSTNIIGLWPYAAAASVVLLLTFTFILRREGADNTGENIVAIIQEEPGSNDGISQDIMPSDLAMEEEFNAHTEKLEAFKQDALAENNESKVQKPLVIQQDPIKSETKTQLQISASHDQPLIAESTRNDAISDITEISKENEETALISTSADPTEVQAVEAPSNNSLRSLARKNETYPTVKNNSDQRNAITSKPGDLGISPALLKIDSTLAYPEIGLQKLAELKRLYGPKNEDLFMRGLRRPYSVSVEFQVGLDGLPVNISIGPDPGDWIRKPVVKILEESGKWIVPYPDYRVQHIFVF